MSHTRKTCAIFALALATLPAAGSRVAAQTAAAKPTVPAAAAAQTQKPKATRAMTRRGTIHTERRHVASQYALPHANAHKPTGQPVLAMHSGSSRLQLAASSDAVRPIPLMPAFEANKSARAVKHSFGSAIAPRTETENMTTGESVILDFDSITTTAVGDPSVADIVPLSTRRLLINAKSPGTTTIFVFDARGKNTVTVDVTPGSNFAPIADRIEKEINIPTVTVRAINDTIFLEGSVPTQTQSDLAMAIASAYTPKVKNLLVTPEQPHVSSVAEKYADLLNENLASSGVTAKVVDDTTIALSGKYALPVGSYSNAGDVGVMTDAANAAQTGTEDNDPLQRLLKSLPAELKVINLINFQKEAAKQILVRAKIIDIDRTSSRSLGLEWGSANYAQTQIGTTDTSQQTVTFQSLASTPILFAQAAGGGFANLLGGGGALRRVEPFATQLSALIQENKARVLSEPSLLVLNGNQGNMIVGGEFPIPVAAGNGAYAVTFKPYGIRLNVQPTLVSEDTIQLTVTPEVSDLDFSNAVTYNGGTVPAVTVRRATTTVQLKDKQTLVIGGLYSTNYSKNVSRIPYLSNIPVLGEFFKSTTKQKIERELLVLIETELVTQDSGNANPPAPGSLENPGINKPYVPRNEFDRDFPDIQNFPHKKDPEMPTQPVYLPDTTQNTAGK